MIDYADQLNIIYYTPHAMAVLFLVFLYYTDIPAKKQFFWRAAVPLTIACCLAHVNRIFHLYPAYLYFPSGHMTFCLGISISLAMLQRWTLVFTFPFLILFGIELVAYDCHTPLDVLGAIPITLLVYGVVHYAWSVHAAAPLDRTKVST